MFRLKRALIWGITFGFGLIWILAFFLPTEIGGGIDRYGMYAPDLLGTTLFYTSGSRKAPQPLSEHQQGAYLVRMDLRATNVRERVFGFSPFRRDDYYGAKRPSVFSTEDGFKLLYLGLGKDDRRRICLAESEDGRNWIPRNRAIFDARETPGGPHWFTVFRTARGYRMLYIVYGRGVVHSATSDDLMNWKSEGVFLRLQDPETPLALSPLSDGRFLLLSQMPEGSPILTVTEIRDAKPVGRVFCGGAKESLPKDVILREEIFRAPFFDEIVDVRAVSDNGRLRILIVGGVRPTENEAQDGRLRIGLWEGTNLEDLRIATGSQPDGSLVALGNPATSTLFHEWAGALANFVPTVMTFGFGMGLISLLSVHGRRLVRGETGRFYSAVVLLALLVMLIVQIGYRTNAAPPDFWKSLNDLLFMKMQFPLGSTMFGLLAAYLVSAAYRAFRIRTFDAAVLTIVAAFVVLAQVPAGQFIGSLFSQQALEVGAKIDAFVTEPRTWLLTVANDAVQRAVGFGAFVGAIAMALRIWLSLDKTSLE
ncbi:MAG TPA: hypothetical protein VNK96_04740 [Fimbriimonadales bacterium]|nr:hypothetical protein [Fimbriimonadales bacterium]